jgi:hypothetical protein
MQLNTKTFIKYKFLNSLFLGLSIGSIFTIYAPLKPSIYSIGGIILALSMLLIAKFYKKIMNINYFYKISLAVEIVLLVLICYFLIFSYSYTTALFVYIGYQITFVFGSYLVRAETLFLKRSAILGFVDIAKQKGYLSGMLLSFLFYKALEYLNITQNKIQVYDIHFLLLVVETLIIYFLIKSFKDKNVISKMA